MHAGCKKNEQASQFQLGDIFLLKNFQYKTKCIYFYKYICFLMIFFMLLFFSTNIKIYELY